MSSQCCRLLGPMDEDLHTSWVNSLRHPLAVLPSALQQAWASVQASTHGPPDLQQQQQQQRQQQQHLRQADLSRLTALLTAQQAAARSPQQQQLYEQRQQPGLHALQQAEAQSW